MVTVPAIGELRHRVSLLAPIEQRTARGGITATPQILAARLPARVLQRLTGPAAVPGVRGDQVAPRNEYDVVFRFRADVSTRQQLHYHARGGDRLLEIVTVSELDPQQRFWALVCREAA